MILDLHVPFHDVGIRRGTDRRDTSNAAAAGGQAVGMILTLGLAGLWAWSVQPAAAAPRVLDQASIERVWAGHPVGFFLLTQGPRQFVAYYDADRRMTVAYRELGEREWIRHKLDSKVGWDSHNGIVLALDRDGHLHVSGNMHVNRLVYFRAENPYDVRSLRPVHRMTGQAEGRVTYPRFLRGPDGRLLFMYRDGSSGRGRRLVNVYDESTRSWQRWIDRPLLDGSQHDMNAYPTRVQKGPDGWFHLVWMWRDTPDCRSNHDISHARSRDLKQWESMRGRPVALPITPDTLELVVDPVPPNRGLINMGFGLGFDPEDRPVVHYHKYDRKGSSQIYAARWEGTNWNIVAVSDWDDRWEFGGGGSVPCRVAGGSVRVLPDGRLVQTWRHVQHGSGAWELDPASLKPRGTVTLPKRYPPRLGKPRSARPGMQVRWCEDSGSGEDPNIAYALRWETLSANRDRPRPEPAPEPVMLEVYTLQR